MGNGNLAYDLIFGRFIYRLLESAKLIPQNDFEKHFNPKGIRFSIEFTTKLAKAQLESVEEYISKNGSQEINYWLKDRLNEAKQYQELRQHYLNIFVKQLEDIKYRKWKAMDGYLSFMSLQNDLL